jgi:hypothetical protein
VSRPAPAIVTAPLRLRLAALGLDAALLAALGAALTIVVNALAGPLVGDVFTPFWRDPAPVAVESRPIGERELDALDDGTRVTRDWTIERRLYPDGSVRLYTVMHATLTAPGGEVERLDAELLIGRSVAALIRLRLTQALLILGPFLWLAAFEASHWRATPGKLAMGLEVLDADGRRLGFARSLLRQSMKLVELGATGLGYFIGVLTGDGRALHDRLSGTQVVRAHAPLRALAPA